MIAAGRAPSNPDLAAFSMDVASVANSVLSEELLERKGSAEKLTPSDAVAYFKKYQQDELLLIIREGPLWGAVEVLRLDPKTLGPQSTVWPRYLDWQNRRHSRGKASSTDGLPAPKEDLISRFRRWCGRVLGRDAMPATTSAEDSNVVVEAKHLGKAYQLYAHRNDWLKQVLFGWWKTYFKPFWVLRDINISIKRGESVGILGRNGCGKSTLLQVICGMTLPTHGELRVSGRIAPVLALGSTFDMELSGRENVLIGGAVLGLRRSQVLQKFDSIAEFAGIGDYMDQPVKHYSMGMRTRLAFSICAHVEAEILVVDEALSVGDAAFQRKCLDWIDNFRKTGTLLFVSHSMAEVRRLCTRAIWIEDGRIREQGDPNEVIRSYHRALLVESDDARRFSARDDSNQRKLRA